MDGFVCSIHALIACFNWSGFYVDGGLQFQDEDAHRTGYYTDINHGGNAIETVITPYPYSADENPYGRFALGYQVEFKSVTISLEASHMSSLSTNADHGVNAIGFRARWYPFR